MKQKVKEPKTKQGVARLLELAGEKKGRLIAACTLSVLSSAARIIPFFTIYGVIAALLRHYTDLSAINSSYILRLAGITFASALVYGICAFYSSALAHTAAYDIIYELRIKLMKKLARIPSGYFTGTTQGAIKKIVSDDAEQIEAFIAHHICDISAAIATPIFTLLFLFLMDWRLALVTLVPIFISLFLLSACLNKPDKTALQIEMHDAQEAMQGTIVEYIHGMPVIKVFNRTLTAFRRYEHDLTAFVAAVSKTAHSNAKPMGAYYAFFGAQLLFLIPASLPLLSTAEGYLDFLPVILLFFLVGGGLKEPLENMMLMVIHSTRIMEGINRIDNILKQPEINETGTGNPTDYDVTFSGVSFSYTGDTQAVKNVSFRLPQGSVTGLVGPSGGGKSTLAQLLLRFYEPQQGSIKIGGVDIQDIPPSRLTNLVSYVFQDSFLFRNTVENNIRMGDTQTSFNAVMQAAKNAGIHDVIMSLPDGYQTIIGEQDAYLSGGEKQRIAIARVFLRDTPIVILDEATAYADAENEAKIQQAFASLAKSKTVLIIAHRLKTVEKANQILVMENGSLIDSGSHRELLETCSAYRDMVTANERRERWTIKKGAAVL
ncbi:ABC transporter ATP-binding protein [Konateibacter massiliensis]|uniref:ABC transporter ATP-binding protein n=1 Tax=Konateibacter massiliensis TaxID=2002841 RepID=UPI000C148B15|nr:ABC transporter ATP-binding protein [Konateibacter massiliensis]